MTKKRQLTPSVTSSIQVPYQLTNPEILTGVTRLDGEPLTPSRVLKQIKEWVEHGKPARENANAIRKAIADKGMNAFALEGYTGGVDTHTVLDLLGGAQIQGQELGKQRVQAKGGKTKADRDKARFEHWQYLQAKYLLNGGNWSLSTQAQAELIMKRHPKEPSLFDGQGNPYYDVATVAKRLIPTKGKDQAQLRDKLQNILDACKGR